MLFISVRWIDTRHHARRIIGWVSSKFSNIQCRRELRKKVILLRILHLLTHLIQLGISFFDFVTSSNRNLLFDKKITKIDNTQPTIIYAHWSQTGEFRKDEIKLFDFFISKNWNVVVVSNCVNNSVPRNFFEDEHNSRLFIVNRKNRGRDLGAMRDGINALAWEDEKQIDVLFLNSSTLYLPSNFDRFLELLSCEKSGFFTATKSSQPFNHFQTFCFGFSRFEARKIREVFKCIHNTRLKQTAVSFGELRISRLNPHLVNSARVLFPNSSLRSAAISNLVDENSPLAKLGNRRIIQLLEFASLGVSINPSHLFWRELLELGFPGLKIELFKKNPARVTDLSIFEIILNSNLISDLSGLFDGEVEVPRGVTAKLRRKFRI